MRWLQTDQHGTTIWHSVMLCELAREYHLLKLALAKRYPEDRGSYTSAKGSFIEKVLPHKEI
jgi:hypothetical protein